MNGFSTEEDSHSGGHDQICCLIESNYRCGRQAGNASYSKRIQKTVLQRRLRLARDDSVRNLKQKSEINVGHITSPVMNQGWQSTGYYMHIDQTGGHYCFFLVITGQPPLVD